MGTQSAEKKLRRRAKKSSKAVEAESEPPALTSGDGEEDDEACKGHGHHHGHGHSHEEEEEEEVNYYGGTDDDDDAGVLSELSSCISWPFALFTGILGMFVLYNLPAVSALFSGGHIQLKLGDTLLADFNA